MEQLREEELLVRTFAGHSSALPMQAFRQIAASFGAALFLVGGCLRDALLGRPFRELDLLLSGDPAPFLESAATNPRMKIVPLDEARGIYRLVLKGERRFFFDFTSCPAGEVEKNLLERDFSVNALALNADDLAGGKIRLLDPQNGFADLKTGTIRTGTPEILKADPLRILRAFRLAAILRGRIEEKTKGWLVQTSPLLSSVSVERIRDELFKILAVEEAQPWLVEMDRDGILELILPEISSLKGVAQGRFHQYDVWGHSLETVRHLESLIRRENYRPREKMSAERTGEAWLKFVALFHDIAKPPTRSVDENGNVHFYRHEEEGSGLIEALCARLRLSAKETGAAAALIRRHLDPLRLAREPNLTPHAIPRFFRRVSPYAREALLLGLADTMAKGKPAPETEAFIERLLAEEKATIR